ncbi:MAG: hypothetical protein IV100_06455, partial [Myxococcales bacterium]|nr:hypothetical protein [Myxococcales bacterium]
MNTRTRFGMHLAMSSGPVGVFAFAALALDEVGWGTGVVLATLGAAFLLAGLFLVVTRGAWSSSLTSSHVSEAAFYGVAWGPAAALAAALWWHWWLGIVALPLPAVLGASAATLWLSLPEPVRSVLRVFLPFSQIAGFRRAKSPRIAMATARPAPRRARSPPSS